MRKSGQRLRDSRTGDSEQGKAAGVAADPSGLDLTGNFGDLPIWDRLFGTYRDSDEFAAQCGFPRHNERHLSRMLLFQDVYDRRP